MLMMRYRGRCSPGRLINEARRQQERRRRHGLDWLEEWKRQKRCTKRRCRAARKRQKQNEHVPNQDDQTEYCHQICRWARIEKRWLAGWEALRLQESQYGVRLILG